MIFVGRGFSRDPQGRFSVLDAVKEAGFSKSLEHNLVVQFLINTSSVGVSLAGLRAFRLCPIQKTAGETPALLGYGARIHCKER